MIYYTSFQPEHLLRLDIQDAQAEEIVLAMSMPEKQLLANDTAFTGWDDGVCLGMAGICEYWTGRAFAWALVSQHAGPRLKALTKRVRQALDEHPARRIEASVLWNFKAGHRWAKALGFELETLMMPHYDPHGRAMSMYVRLK